MQTDTKTAKRYSDEDLAEFKTLIDKKLATANSEIEFLREQIQGLEEQNGDEESGDSADQSNYFSEVDRLQGMLTRQQEFAAGLTRALTRIVNKTYGICTVTGDLISKERLRLVPHTTKSVRGKELEASGQTGSKPVEEVEETRKRKKAKETQPKIITKVIRKANGPKPEKPLEEEDFYDNSDDLDLDDGDPDIDMDDLSEEDSYLNDYEGDSNLSNVDDVDMSDDDTDDDEEDFSEENDDKI